MCNSWCEAIIAIVILVFMFWQTAYSDWIVIIAAIVLLVHSFTCKNCFVGGHMSREMMPAKKRRR